MKFKIIGCFLSLILLSCSNESSTQRQSSENTDSSPSSQISDGLSIVWKAHAECEEINESAPLVVNSCFDDNTFHLDGNEILGTIANYVCLDSIERMNFEFKVNPPELASSLFDIASNNLLSDDMPSQDREYVQPIVDSYSNLIETGDNVYSTLLKLTVNTLEADVNDISNHVASSEIREKIVLPENCEYAKSEETAKSVIAISSEAVQRFTNLYWYRLTDTIARGNRTVEIEEAGIFLPEIILSSDSVDLTSQIYGYQAPGNGAYPAAFADIDIIQPDYDYSRFAVPLGILPQEALSFLSSQSSFIASQLDDLLDALSNDSGTAVIYSLSPDSTEVFSPVFWVENILWQIAYREVLISEGLDLNPDSFSTYGLH